MTAIKRIIQNRQNAKKFHEMAHLTAIFEKIFKIIVRKTKSPLTNARFYGIMYGVNVAIGAD